MLEVILDQHRFTTAEATAERSDRYEYIDRRVSVVIRAPAVNNRLSNRDITAEMSNIVFDKHRLHACLISGQRLQIPDKL